MLQIDVGKDICLSSFIGDQLNKIKGHMEKASQLQAQVERIEHDQPIDSARLCRESAHEEEQAFHSIRNLQALAQGITTDDSFLEEIHALERKLPELCRQTATKYSKSANLFGNYELLEKANSLGLASRAYLRIVDLTNEKRVYVPSKQGIDVIPGDTPLGRAIECYYNAMLALTELGVQYEQENSARKAHLSYGYAADALASSALAYEKAECSSETEELLLHKYARAAEKLRQAGEVYKKSAILSKQYGIGGVVANVRLLWQWVIPQLHDLFKDQSGYSIGDEFQRAIKCYEKAKGYYENEKNTERATVCSQEILRLSENIKEPSYSIQICQDICSKSEYLILPITTGNSNLNMDDRTILLQSCRDMLSRPQDAAFKIIDHLLPKLRNYVLRRLSSEPNWFQSLVWGKLDGNARTSIENNYSRETGNIKGNLVKDPHAF